MPTPAVEPGLHTLLNRAARWLIKAYQWLISPLLGPRCRHLPTCSEFALEALENHGLWHGTRLGIGRILRCHPWGTSGYDPVPATGELSHKGLFAGQRTPAKARKPSRQTASS